MDTKPTKSILSRYIAPSIQSKPRCGAALVECKQMESDMYEPGTKEWLAAKSIGPKWQYDDARGISHIGYMQKTSDFGGTDVTYWMRDGETGELALVSGSRAKAMKRI